MSDLTVLAADRGGAGHRSGQRWRFDLLDMAGSLVEQGMRGITADGATIDMSEVTDPGDIERTGEVTVTGRPDIDWSGHQLRIWYECDQIAPIPLLTGLAQAPGETHNAATSRQRIRLADHTQLLAADDYGRQIGYPTDTPIVETARDIALSASDLAVISVTDPAVLDLQIAAPIAPASWASKLMIARTVLDAGNLLLRADGLGQLAVTRHVPLADRTVLWRFDRNYLPDWDRSRDLTAAPNRWVCVQRTDGGTPAATYAAEDTRPESPFSYDARGRRWITGGVETVDAADYETLQQIAWRRLTEAQQVADEVTITHLPLPGVTPGARAEFVHPRLDTVMPAVVLRQRYQPPTATTAGWVTSTIRRIT